MRARRLTRRQKIVLSQKGFQTPGQFLLLEETVDDLVLVDKSNGNQITVPKKKG